VRTGDTPGGPDVVGAVSEPVAQPKNFLEQQRAADALTVQAQERQFYYHGGRDQGRWEW
jgi:hypothetical protein